MSQIAGAPGDVRVEGAEAVLAQLDDEQRAAASAVSGPVCILAGAGTGKTRTITHRIAYGVHTGAFVPEQVLAVTFTARAAGELRTRLRALDIGSVDIRRRGLAGDVENLHRHLKLRGTQRATLVMTRFEDRPWALICAALAE